MIDAILNIQAFTVELLSMIEISLVQITLALTVIGYLVKLEIGIKSNLFFLLFFISLLLKPVFYQPEFVDLWYVAAFLTYLLLAFSGWFTSSLKVVSSEDKCILLIEKRSFIDRLIVYLFIAGMLNNIFGHLFKVVLDLNSYKPFYSITTILIDSIAIGLLTSQIFYRFFKND